MVDLCTGLEDNKSISEFEISECSLKNAEIESLAPFIRKNPSLHTLNIEGCFGASLGASGFDLNLLSSALMSRTQSIENVSLDGNFMGGEGTKDAFDTLITALNKNTELTRLSLMCNRIGKEGCISLGRLLKDPNSKLKSLILRHNYIDDECAAILAESLSNNTSLFNIDLDRNERVSAEGLMKFVHLISRNGSICDTVESNHTISSIGYETALRRNFIQGNLLREFLEANKRTDKRSTARVKVFRCHIQYKLSLEDVLECDAVMHRVLAWIGHALSESDKAERTFLTQAPPTAVRLGAIYHILRAMPILCRI